MSRIEVKGLGKKYKRYNNKFSRLVEWISTKKLHRDNWVLRDISFNVEDSESIGIIGHNGAGKSTLLKLLTGATKASEGRFHIQGRIAALLELGMGFHPDFTGIENIYLASQLMGFTNEEIEKLIPDIKAFAEIGDYIYQPIRTYSSGMIVRLGFSVATAIRPDILIVDEALSVGDAYFQHKCFDRIREFRELGTTIFFVSHDPGAVKNLCDRAILLDNGRLIKEGRPDEILDYYNAIIAKREVDYQIKQSKNIGNHVSTRSGNGDLEITNVTILNNEKEVNAIQVGSEMSIKVTIKCKDKEVEDPTVGFTIKDRLGNEIYGTNTFYLKQRIGKLNRENSCNILFKISANLGVGTYSLTVAAHNGNSHINNNYDWWDHAATFQVISGEQPYFVGTSYIKTEVSTEENLT